MTSIAPSNSDNTNHLFPVFIKLENFKVLIVGGGMVALEKLNTLLNNAPHTNIRVVAKEIHPDILSLVGRHKNVRLRKKEFATKDLAETDFVITALNDLKASEKIFRAAHKRKILINTADTPNLCDFYLGSIVQKGNLKIAISTNGKSPTVAKRLKEMFQDLLPSELDEVISNMHTLRERLRGDFAMKVRRLNKITKSMSLNSKSRKRLKSKS